MEEEMARKEAEQMQKLAADLDSKRLEQERLAKEAEEKAAAQKDASAAEAIIADARKQQELMESRIKDERKSQQEKIRAKLKAKKAKRMQAMKAKHTEDKLALQDAATQSLRDAKAEAYHAGELERLQILLADLHEPPYDVVKQMVQRVTEARCREEQMDLRAHQMRKNAKFA